MDLTECNTSKTDNALRLRELTSYKGPLLRSLLAGWCNKSDTLFVASTYEFTCLVPFKIAMDYTSFFAMEMNGKPMGVRNRGPLSTYPFKECSKKLNNEVIP